MLHKQVWTMFVASAKAPEEDEPTEALVRPPSHPATAFGTTVQGFQGFQRGVTNPDHPWDWPICWPNIPVP